MEAILSFRQKSRSFFAANEIYFMPVIKFLLMMAVLLEINWHLGYRYLLMRWILVILASLIGCLLPWSGMTALTAVWLLGHVSALSLEGTAVLLLVMLSAAVLHYLFLPGGSYLIVLTPLLFWFRVPFLIPLLVGVFGSALGFIPVGIGTIVYYLLEGLESNALTLLDPGSGYAERVLLVVKSLTENTEMLLALAIVCCVTLVCHGISHLPADYARLIALGVGTVLMILGFALGSMMIGTDWSLLLVILGCLFSLAVGSLSVLWADVRDYSHAELLSFEDDDYVYYVKAIPKIRLADKKRKVHDISGDFTEPEEPQA